MMREKERERQQGNHVLTFRCMKSWLYLTPRNLSHQERCTPFPDDAKTFYIMSISSFLQSVNFCNAYFLSTSFTFARI